MPVGLKNIGNTSYFNSLLQYYFTLLPFREVMINNQKYVEDENSEPKRIGASEVGQFQVAVGKKFVDLIKALFIKMETSEEEFIVPEKELAFMAASNVNDLIATASAEENVNLSLQEDPSSEDIPSDSRSVQARGKEKAAETIKLVRRSSQDFGMQQDVTECMGNVMYLIEAALKPLQKSKDGEQIDDMIRQLFYCEARQILTYIDNETMQEVEKVEKVYYSHFIVHASEGKTLYDGLDQFFFAEKVENYPGGQNATREVTVETLPPVFQVMVQRVHYDRETAEIYKSNAHVEFEKVIYLDRYLNELKNMRNEVVQWQSELVEHEKDIQDYSKPKAFLESSDTVYREYLNETYTEAELDRVCILSEILASRAEPVIETKEESIRELRKKTKEQFKEHTKNAYKIHAVFVHQGQANMGHYWIYILDHTEDQWWKYDDSRVTKADEREVLYDTSGSNANPYFLVYVDADKLDKLVETAVLHK